MNEKIRKMEEENKLIEQGLEHIKFDEWEIDETEKMSLKVRFIQFGNFIIEKLKEAKKMSKERINWDKIEKDIQDIRRDPNAMKALKEFIKYHTS